MSRPNFRKLLTLLAVFLGVWLGLKYLLPILLPFLLGAGLALAAEPMVRLWEERAHLPRGAAAGIGVTLTLALIAGALTILGAVLVRELGMLAGAMPNLEDTARQGISLLENWLLALADRTPDGIRSLLTRSVMSLFSGGAELLDQLTLRIPAMASAVLSHLPDGALGLGTGILSGFMISVRLPKLRTWYRQRLPQTWRERYLPALRGLREALGGWLRAQVKLAGVTFLIVTTGFLALQISYAPLWALMVALVDAVPLLGTGTVLLPWSLVCVLQGNPVRAIGLLGTYAAAALTRSALEPRLVGRQLGMDPLITLAALYAGYRFWGVLGMLLAPMLAVVAAEIANTAGTRRNQ